MRVNTHFASFKHGMSTPLASRPFINLDGHKPCGANGSIAGNSKGAQLAIEPCKASKWHHRLRASEWHSWHDMHMYTYLMRSLISGFRSYSLKGLKPETAVAG